MNYYAEIQRSAYRPNGLKYGIIWRIGINQYTSIIKCTNIVKLIDFLIWSNPINAWHNGYDFKLGKYLQELKMISYKPGSLYSVTPRNISEYNAAYCSGFLLGRNYFFISSFMKDYQQEKNTILTKYNRERDREWLWSCSYPNLKCQFTACIYFYLWRDWFELIWATNDWIVLNHFIFKAVIKTVIK